MTHAIPFPPSLDRLGPLRPPKGPHTVRPSNKQASAEKVIFSKTRVSSTRYDELSQHTRRHLAHTRQFYWYRTCYRCKNRHASVGFRFRSRLGVSKQSDTDQGASYALCRWYGSEPLHVCRSHGRRINWWQTDVNVRRVRSTVCVSAPYGREDLLYRQHMRVRFVIIDRHNNAK